MTSAIEESLRDAGARLDEAERHYTIAALVSLTDIVQRYGGTHFALIKNDGWQTVDLDGVLDAQGWQVALGGDDQKAAMDVTVRLREGLLYELDHLWVQRQSDVEDNRIWFVAERVLLHNDGVPPEWIAAHAAGMLDD